MKNSQPTLLNVNSTLFFKSVEGFFKSLLTVENQENTVKKLIFYPYYANIFIEMDIKENLAKNLTACRKAFNLTQAELAEKLNYSDKAVSKWERGESVPDIVVLKQLSLFYGISIDKLLSDNKNIRPKITKNLNKKRALVGLLSSGLVWLVAILSFAVLSNLELSFTPWLIYIYAFSVNCIVFVVFASIWKRNLFNAISISFLIWSLLLALYLTLVNVLSPVPSRLWQIFLIGIPLQLLVMFWFILVRINKDR